MRPEQSEGGRRGRRGGHEGGAGIAHAGPVDCVALGFPSSETGAL